jgi:hypothetical protein
MTDDTINLLAIVLALLALALASAVLIRAARTGRDRRRRLAAVYDTSRSRIVPRD